MNVETREAAAAKLYGTVDCPTASLPNSRAYPKLLSRDAGNARARTLPEFIAIFRRHGIGMKAMRDLMQLRYSWF